MKKMLFILFLFCGSFAISMVFNKDAPIEINSKASLGKKLFSEKILSLDSSVSCASCHKPAYAFADTQAFSEGINGKHTRRNTPSVLNMKNRPYYFWDGRAETLQDQSLMPIQNPDEMGLSIAEAVNRLRSNEVYSKLFKKIFNRLPDQKTLAEAFAAYENTLETVNSRFDDWSNNLGKLTVQEENGRRLFIGDKAKCFDCHSMEDFTDDSYRNIGLFNGRDLNDSGRYNISGDSNDVGKFKTPGLRNVAVTAPYMHNGMFNTLEEVIDYYNDPVKIVSDPVNIDPSLSKPLGLTSKEKKELVAFLKTLTDKAYQKKQFR